MVTNMLRGIGAALAHANLGLVTLALALHIVGLIVTGERWRVVIAGLGSRLSLYQTTLINLAGIFGASLAPYLATWLAKTYGLAYVGYYLSAAAVFLLLLSLLFPQVRERLSTLLTEFVRLSGLTDQAAPMLFEDEFSAP